jgi:hypothetical protein
MKKDQIMRFNEFLIERKSADLYHLTGIEAVENILSTGAIQTNYDETFDDDPKGAYISLTRDYNYNVYNGEGERVKIIIDQTKLSTSHKISPYAWDGTDFGLEDEGGRNESEERVYKNIPISYIKHIIISGPANPNLRDLVELSELHNIPVTFGNISGDVDHANVLQPIQPKTDGVVKVTEPGLTPLAMDQELNQQEYDKAIADFGEESFEVIAL